MKDRPLIMYPHEVRAVRDGRQTQFRRVIKHQPVLYEFIAGKHEYAFIAPNVHPGYIAIGTDAFNKGHGLVECPYGVPGDRLWVKETWRLFDSHEECACYDLCTCSRYNGKPIYRADSDDESKWRPSIHMPRWASRLLLEVVSVRVERLQEITEEDAKAEGAREYSQTCLDSERLQNLWCKNSVIIAAQRGEERPKIATQIGAYKTFWNSINGKAHPWDSNPWVWVVEFKLIENRG